MAVSAVAARKLALEKRAAQNALNPASQPIQDTLPAVSTANETSTIDATETEPAKRPSKKRKRRQPPPLPSSTQTTTEPARHASAEGKSAQANKTAVTSKATADESNLNGNAEDGKLSALALYRHRQFGHMAMANSNDLSSEVLSDSDHGETATQAPRYEAVSLSSVRKQSVKVKRIGGIRSAVVRLVPGERVVAVGEYDFWVRKGTVTVYGAVLHASHKVYRIHAPSTHALPVILGVQNPYGGDPAAEVVLLSHESGIRRLKTLISGFAGIWNSTDQSRGCTFRILWSSAEDGLQRPLQPFSETSAWKQLATALITNESSSAPSVLICGPKGTGKSTLNRFLTNAFLCSQKYRGVAYLDIDPGQPEYRPPGDLSLCFLQGYNFGPSYTHPNCAGSEKVAARVHHFGFMTPRDDIENYLACVTDLYNAYKQLYQDCPLLINCSGWILGSGLECLEALLNNLRPTDTVYMSQEGPEEVLEVLHAGTKRVASRLHTLASAPGDRMQRTSAELRSMQAMSYFHGRSIEDGDTHWDATPVDEMEQQKWHYAGAHQYIDAMCPYNDELNPDMFNYLVDMSIYAIVAVDNDPQLERELFLDREHQVEQAASEENTWNEQTTTDSQDQMIPEPSNSRTTPIRRSLRRTKEGFPYYSPGNGTYKAFDPSHSQTLGQVLIRSWIAEDKCLRVVTPVPAALIEEHRARGSRIVLARGKLDRPEWAFLEPYHVGLWREAEYEKWRAQYGALAEEGRTLERDVDDGIRPEDDNMRFNVEAWARKTPWVSAVKEDDYEYRRRNKVWKVRRNLETSEGKK